MNKSKMILAAIGGTFAVLILVAGWFVWSAVSARDAARDGDEEEGSDGLETIVNKASGLSRKAIYPCAESVKALERNRTLYLNWKDEALELASRGDKVYPKTTPAAFKEFLIGDAKRLAALPGAVEGKLVKSEFAFGPFKDYIDGSKMPPDGELPTLQRQWDDLSLIVEMLAKVGICELTELQCKSAAPAVAEAGKENTKARRPAKNQAKAGGAKDEAMREPSLQTYVIGFSARPAGLVKALNELALSERFIVLNDFSLTHAKDAVAEALGGEKKEAEAKSEGSRRRRGRRAAESAAQEKKEDSAKKGVVTDPSTDEPIAVVLTVSVYDFGSLEEEKK